MENGRLTKVGNVDELAENMFDILNNNKTFVDTEKELSIFL